MTSTAERTSASLSHSVSGDALALQRLVEASQALITEEELTVRELWKLPIPEDENVL